MYVPRSTALSVPPHRQRLAASGPRFVLQSKSAQDKKKQKGILRVARKGAGRSRHLYSATLNVYVIKALQTCMPVEPALILLGKENRCAKVIHCEVYNSKKLETIQMFPRGGLSKCVTAQPYNGTYTGVSSKVKQAWCISFQKPVRK